MNMIGAAAFGVGAVFLALYLKPQQKEIAVLIGICAAVMLFTGAISGAAEALRTILDFAEGSGLDETAKTMVRALGIAAVGQITADICREAGENTVSTQVEQFARIEILLLSLPLAAQLIELVREMLG